MRTSSRICRRILTYPDAWHVVQQVLSKVIAYIQQNELTKWIKIVYLYEDLNDPVIRALADNLRVIDRCFPKVSPRLPNQLAHLFFLQPRTSSERLHPSQWTHVMWRVESVASIMKSMPLSCCWHKRAPCVAVTAANISAAYAM